MTESYPDIRNEGANVLLAVRIFLLQKTTSMKNFLSFIFAGIIGGLIAFGGIKYTSHSTAEVAPENLSQQVSLINQKPSAVSFPGNFTEAAQKAMPVVVHIKATAGVKSVQNNEQNNPFGGFFGEDFFGGSPRPQSGAGSGVFISSDGYIVTNNHVVSFADELEVTTYDNRTYTAKVIGTDPGTDLAVIKIDATNMPTLNYADSDQAQVGEWVLAVGNPFDLTSTVTAGIISAKGRSIRILEGKGGIESFIQTDAAVNPGNSGGALVDNSGKLLGINTAIATQTGSYAGYSFAIPANLMKKIVDDIIEFGSFQRAYLGISINEMDAELSTELGVNISQGVFVKELADGGAASYAGILPRDIITAVNSRPIKTVPELQEIVGSAQVGDVLNITVNRKGTVKEIPVKLKAQQR